jgi:large subunit ribosomal protein L25
MALPKHILSAESRTEKGKGAARKMRGKDIVPGVYYTKDANIPVKVPEIPLWKTYYKAGLSQVFQLEIDQDGKKTKTPTMIKDIQFYPTKTKIMHVDFIGIDMKKKLRVQLPVEVEGEAAGVKEGGVLEIYRDFVEIECLPDLIPENIRIDVTELGINDSVHVQDVTLPEGVVAVNFEENFAILGVSVPTAVIEEVEEEEEELLEGEEAEGEEGEEGEEAAEEASEEAE